MGIRSILKDIWNALTEAHGPFSPAPEVKESLEKKGYQFKEVTLTAPIATGVTLYNITSPEGDDIGRTKTGSESLAQYFRAYKQTAEECRSKEPAMPPSRLKGFLKNLFKEAHHPLNPSPEVMKTLQEKGYKFTFNPLAGRGFITNNYTVTTPYGTPIGINYIPVNKLAVARYNLDYVQAVKQCAQHKPS
ncbi:MAG: hypothetical protein CO093_02435 [Alphaproteobacteria bacterium CG_4_9_14_3_um_filter_47_13]|nr:MAG: hypothetical protein CO093_02435 [Alphaproteobacteria bacterium CG_4_9_14_3_um_filter_47_13]